MSFNFEPQDSVTLNDSQEVNATRVIFSDHNSYPEYPENIHISAYHGSISRASQCSDSAGSARANCLQIPSEASSTCAASNSPRLVKSTSNIQSFDSHVNDDFINIKREYALEISRLREAQRQWMTAAADLQPSLKANRNAPHAFTQLEKAWSDILDIEARARRYELTLNSLDGHAHPLTICTPLEDANPPEASNLEEDDPAKVDDSRQSTSSTHSSPHLPEIVESYYEHASAIQYISDELINLGPRPVSHSAPQIMAESIRPVSDISDSITPYEYAERHLELLRDLAFARQEADKYKQLCIEQGFELEHEVEPPGAQGEDMYTSILDELEYGAARIDSMMELSAHQEQYPSDMTSATMQSQGTSRVAEWATSVASQSHEPLDSALVSEHQAEPSFLVADYTDPRSTDDDNRQPERSGPSFQRMPSRRRSTTTINQMRQGAPVFSCPTRSDSGIGLQEMERHSRSI